MSPSIPTPPPQGYALFLDFDGTLTPLRHDPDPHFSDPALETLLLSCYKRNQQALAIVTGRAIGNIKSLLPLPIPFVGQHGLEFMDASGNHSQEVHVGDDLEKLVTALQPRLDTLGLKNEVENKGIGIALYHHHHPEHHHTFVELVETVLAEHAPALSRPYTLQRGKHIVEVKPAGYNKGTAITRLMTTPPFAGRVPIFFGDDLTDEHGFNAIRQLGGIAVKVGQGETAANHRVNNVDEVRQWLQNLF